MIPAIVTLLAADHADAAEKTSQVHGYACGQTNPTQYASFSLRFRTDGSLGSDRPISATLVDRESHTVTVRSGNPARTPDWDVVGADAWQIGRDIGGTVYLLSIPRAELDETVDVQVIQVFGGGRAQWVNEFSCVRR